MSLIIDKEIANQISDLPFFELSSDLDEFLELFPSSSSTSTSTSNSNSLDSSFNIVLEEIANKGVLPQNLSWPSLQNFLAHRLNHLLDTFYQKYGFNGPITESFSEKKMLIFTKLFSNYYKNSPPFSLQRLVEVLIDHSFLNKYCYHSTNNLLNAFIKILSVDRTLDDFKLERF